jgi:hypothetical protein
MSNTEQKPLNTMSTGMWPMNYGAKLVKEAADVLFSLGLDDRGSVESRLDSMEKTINALRASMAELQGRY